MHLQPSAAQCVKVDGLKARDLDRVDRDPCSTSRPLILPQLGQGLHWGQSYLCPCGTLDLNGLPANLAIRAHCAQEDGPRVWHNLKILKPLLTECWSCKHRTACRGLDGLKRRSTLDDLLRLDEDLLRLLAVSVVRLNGDVLVEHARRRAVTLLCLGGAIRG